jgi:hypothetical protein
MRDALSAYPFREAIRWSLRRETSHADGIKIFTTKDTKSTKVLLMVMDKKYALAEIEKEVKRLATIIGSPDNMLPTYGYSKDFAYPHIEADSRGYHYVIVERGKELQRVTTQDLDVLLYHIFEGITAEMGTKYSATHRLENQDFRRSYFQRQIGLLKLLSPKWAEIESKEHERILQQYPYDDFASLRARLMKSLRDQGNSPEEARKIAYEKYPQLKTS